MNALTAQKLRNGIAVLKSEIRDLDAEREELSGAAKGLVTREINGRQATVDKFKAQLKAEGRPERLMPMSDILDHVKGFLIGIQEEVAKAERQFQEFADRYGLVYAAERKMAEVVKVNAILEDFNWTSSMDVLEGDHSVAEVVEAIREGKARVEDSLRRGSRGIGNSSNRIHNEIEIQQLEGRATWLEYSWPYFDSDWAHYLGPIYKELSELISECENQGIEFRELAPDLAEELDPRYQLLEGDEPIEVVTLEGFIEINQDFPIAEEVLDGIKALGVGETFTWSEGAGGEFTMMRVS